MLAAKQVAKSVLSALQPTPPKQQTREHATVNNEDYEWDKHLIFDEKFWKKFYDNKDDDKKYDPVAASKTPFPSDSLLSIFSSLAYQRRHKGLEKPWVVLTTAHNEYGRTSAKSNIDSNTIDEGYFGVAFWNPILRQVVVAHKGTNWKNPDDRKSDWKILLDADKTKQSQSAATFVHLISDEIKKAAEAKIHIQLSITGHSLGGWIAQITTFTVKYFKKEGTRLVKDEKYLENIHAHAVVFDCPGCYVALKKLRERFIPPCKRSRFGSYHSLDMTVYLNHPNCVNSLHKHVGTIYLTESTKHTVDDVVPRFDKNGKINKRVVLDFPYGRRVSLKLLITRAWVRFRSNMDVPTEAYEDDGYSLNVFNEIELNFIRNWNNALENPANRKQLESDYSIPKLTIDDDNNLIRNVDDNNLSETIAKIKKLRPTINLIFKSLEVKEQNRILYKQLQWEKRDYQKELLMFPNYYFEDKYRLRNFLRSHNQILHVYMSSDADVKIQMSILNNIFLYYKTENPENRESVDFKYGFLYDWNKLDLLPRVKLFYRKPINLIVVECCNEDSEAISTITKLLEKDNVTKIIAVSMKPWAGNECEGKFEEVSGHGNDITFADLTRESREKLLNQTITFSGNRYHLNKILTVDPLPSNEILFELLEKPENEDIIINCQNNTSLDSVYFVDFRRKINLVDNRINHHPQIQYIVEDPTNCSLSGNHKAIFDEASKDVEINVKFERNNLKKEKAYLFKVEGQELFVEKIYNSKFYMPRHVHHTRNVEETIFKCRTELYYFCGSNKKIFDKMTEKLDEEQNPRFKFIRKESEAIHKVKNVQTNAHLFKICDDQIVWLHSNKHISSLRKHISSKGISSVPENKLMNNKNVVIIEGSAGMGKSSTIAYLHEYYRNEKHWVFTIPLQHSAFNELADNINFETATKYILKSCNILETRFVEYLLSYCLKNETKLAVYLFLDAFDEIHEELYRQRVLNLIEFLQSHSTAKMLITTRTFRCQELEDKLCLFASSFKMSDGNDERTYFLKNVWSTQQHLFRRGMSPEQLGQFVANVLKNLDKSLGKTMSNFKDVPLYTRMIAEIITPPLHHSNPTVSGQAQITTILKLYSKYVQTHYNTYFKRSGVNVNEAQQIWLQKSISSRLRELAVAKLPISSAIDPDDDNEELKQLYNDHNFKKELEELNKVGLIQSNIPNSADFFHETLRDYFGADALKLWLETYSENSCNIENFIVSTFLTSSEFKAMRLFLNCLLENISISSKRLEQCRNKIEQLEESARLNDNRETAFHICVKEQLYSLSQHFLFMITEKINKTELLSALNLNLQSPLFLAVDDLNVQNGQQSQQSNRNMLTIIFKEICNWPYDDVKKVLLAALCNHSTTEEHVKILNTYLAKYIQNEKLQEAVNNRYNRTEEYFKACQTNCFADMKLILQEFEDDDIAKGHFLSRTNDHGKTGLHLTTCVEMVKLLLDHHADINSRDSHGMTPLTRAIKNGRTEIAMTLIEKEANLDIEDNMGYTPIAHAAKVGNLDVLKLLVQFKNPSESKVDKTTCFGVTPLMLAANFGNYDVMEFLLENKANPYLKDRHGMTVVNHAIKKGNFLQLAPLFEQFQIYAEGEYRKIVKGLGKGNNKQYNQIKQCHEQGIMHYCQNLKLALHKLNNKALKHNFLFEKNDFGETSLHLVTCVETLKLLLEHGALINTKDDRGMTPLNRAVKEGRTEIAIVLIENNADINISDTMGYSPLINAAKHNNLDVLKLLLDSKDPRKNQVNKCTNFEVTALMFAAKIGNYEMMVFLLEHGADPLSVDKNGMTMVHHSIKGNNYSILELIFEKFNLEEENGCVRRKEEEEDYEMPIGL